MRNRWGAAAPQCFAPMIVYAIPISLYCAKLRILLRHKSIDWREEPPPSGYGSEAYRRIVPSGNLPALIDDGLLLADSEAIAEYLNEKFPEPAMLPDEMSARAKVRELSRFHDTRLEPALRALFPHIREEQRQAALVAEKSRSLSQRVEQLASLVGAGPRSLSLGDCGFAISFAWIDSLKSPLGLDVHWPENVAAYRKWLEQCPAVAAELADYRPKLEQWLDQR